LIMAQPSAVLIQRMYVAVRCAAAAVGRLAGLDMTFPAHRYVNPYMNQILAVLPEEDCERLGNSLERVPLALGTVLYEPGATMTHAYFPVSGIVSILYVMDNGDSAEIAIIGSEGMVGISLLMGGDSTTSRAVVQNAGEAWRLEAAPLRREFARGGVLHKAGLMYTQNLMIQMTQTAACNRHHPLDKQLCRWLLLSLDRLPGAQLTMTLKLISNMLGMDVPGVAAALDSLQEAGIVRHANGVVTVLDRPQLEARVCECYEVVKKAYARQPELEAAA